MAGAKVKTLAGQDRLPRVCGGSPGSAVPPQQGSTQMIARSGEIRCWKNSSFRFFLHSISWSKGKTRPEMKMVTSPSQASDWTAMGLNRLVLSTSSHISLLLITPSPLPSPTSFLFCSIFLGRWWEREQHPRSFGCLFQHLFFTGIPLLSVSPSSPFSSLSTLADVSENQPHSVDTETSLLLLLVTWSWRYFRNTRPG